MVYRYAVPMLAIIFAAIATATAVRAVEAVAQEMPRASAQTGAAVPHNETSAAPPSATTAAAAPSANGGPPASGGPPANTAPPVNTPPPQAATQTASQASQTKTSGNGAVLGTSGTRKDKDVCGNDIGTQYGEGRACTAMESQKGPYITYKTPWEQWLTLLAAGMAVAYAGIYALVQVFGQKPLDEAGTRYFIVITVIGSAVFALTAGYDNQQAAPIYGLFGTLIGYLFGRSQGDAEKETLLRAAGAGGPSGPLTGTGTTTGTTGGAGTAGGTTTGTGTTQQ